MSIHLFHHPSPFPSSGGFSALPIVKGEEGCKIERLCVLSKASFPAVDEMAQRLDELEASIKAGVDTSEGN